MHRLLMAAPPGLVVDHINRDSLDNRKSNLRLVTVQQNACNRGRNRHRPNSTTIARGVRWRRRDNTWVVQYSRNGRVAFLKYCRTLREALLVAQKAVVEVYGPLADTSEFQKLLEA